ncbi:hypothetical protein C5167_017266 [Papaver somniferum]|uniref:Uncharacterized protein n=1 Tax=Papaver somniferum TaxID=3469 RepID=A0A4Y7IMX6_PAPSO|nr:hypothetical protein C5167_017266 [Papaver somniferum]
MSRICWEPCFSIGISNYAICREPEYSSQIENAPIVDSDTNLYAPPILNISTFKRSYGLMERMLKVYVYKELNPSSIRYPSRKFMLMKRVVHETAGRKQKICI